jgi:hypothetical protein
MRPGFIEYEPECWRMGSHAAKSRRQAPRRPKRFSLEPGIVAPEPWERDTAITSRDERGRVRSASHPVSLEQGVPLTLICPVCRAPSRVSLEAVMTMFVR